MPRHADRKQHTREYATRNGLTYQRAEAQLRARRADPEHDRVRRYVLSGEVAAILAGEGLRGVAQVEPADAWLARRTPRYECDVCHREGDARIEDTTLGLVMAAYDPDISPVTGMISSRRQHAACGGCWVHWAYNVEIPQGPTFLSLPAIAEPDLAAELSVEVHPILLPDGEGEQQPALMTTVQVTKDAGAGAAAWLSQLELMLREAGFGTLDDPGEAEGWSVRVVEHYPASYTAQWVAVRATPARDGVAPDHVYLGAWSPSWEWLAAVGRSRHILLIVGPVSVAGEVPDPPDPGNVEALWELDEEGALLAAQVPFELDDMSDRVPRPERPE
ncbi:hypothetical protein [Bailinhaonella thermotolerans]|uniref:Uncharacterized protein n=1 Tax=Bailinhaonella thermotolerans TaxID=1070861 RepID=A0A3A4A1C0_9ACTN|nr:hypothetical protein [Bailinhaonella thermotolerans]RJL21052.1 hypothetical protein D5H75_38205 [Bailinhaonella thermotolerans]